VYIHLRIDVCTSLHYSSHSMTSVKMEPGSTPIIKPDPDNKDSSPGAMSEDDIYEETGDLDFSGADQDVWLTKIPRFLYENWSKLDDDEEVQIGTVRVESGPSDMQRVCSFLFMPSQGNISLTIHLLGQFKA
jgi:hypothetical protein